VAAVVIMKVLRDSGAAERRFGSVMGAWLLGAFGGSDTHRRSDSSIGFCAYSSGAAEALRRTDAPIAGTLFAPHPGTVGHRRLVRKGLC